MNFVNFPYSPSWANRALLTLSDAIEPGLGGKGWEQGGLGVLERNCSMTSLVPDGDPQKPPWVPEGAQRGPQKLHPLKNMKRVLGVGRRVALMDMLLYTVEWSRLQWHLHAASRL